MNLFENIPLYIPVIIALSLSVLGLLVLFFRKPKSVSNNISFHNMLSRDYSRLEKNFKDKIKKFENKNELVLYIIHDLEFRVPIANKEPESTRISFEEAFFIIGAIRRAKRKDTIKIILHTLGGYSLPATMIADAIRQHSGDVIIYIPYVAMSAGTILALAADDVHMGKTARLGPVDSIFNGFTLDAFNKLSDEKEKELQSDVIALTRIEAEKFETYSREEIRRLTNLVHKKNDKHNHFVPDKLSEGKMSHGEAIDAKRASDWGMKIDASCPDIVYDITDIRIRIIKTRFEKLKTNEDE